jgi:hypothetical protein
MGRLTLRKFYLLLAEYYEQERLMTDRFYKLICCHLKEPVAAETLFPLMRREDPADPDGDEVDDETNFRAVTASLMPYQK